MNLSVEDARFTEGEASELSTFRPLNRLAVVSVALGFISALGLVHPFFICFAALGLAIGLVAVRQLTTPDSPQTGITVARWGVFLCLLFGFWVGTKELTRQRAIAKQARDCSERWLGLVREGKTREAHQLTMPAQSRVAAGTSLDKHYAPREKPRRAPDADSTPMEMMAMSETSPFEQYQQFFSGSMAKRLMDLGNDATYSYLGTVEQVRSGVSDIVVKQEYGVETQGKGRGTRFVVTVSLERTLYNHIATWRIMGVSAANRQ